MDPWMESTWGDVHATLIAYAREAIMRHLPPGLHARIQQRVFVESIDARPGSRYPDLHIVEQSRPFGAGSEATQETAEAGQTAVATAPLRVRILDDPVTQGFVEISDSSGTVITVLEFLSPSNKIPGMGQKLYLDKQRELRSAGVSLVEIDLVRTGDRVTTITPEQLAPPYQTPYYAIVTRANDPEWAEVYPISLRESLPTISVPLRPKEADVTLPLQSLIEKAYLYGGYEWTDYSKPPVPALTGADAVWAAELLRAANRI
jgi:hypothetical protein